MQREDIFRVFGAFSIQQFCRESVSQKSFPLPIVESASFREMIGHKTCLQSSTRLVFSWSSVLFIRSVFNVKLFIINVENENYGQNL